jgi:acyl-CoA thioester hydrolase
MTMTDLLTEYPVVVTVPVQWCDMDAYGVVNSTVYFRYFSASRVAYLEKCGFVHSYESHRIGAILHSAECRYRQPLRYPDTVLVGTRVTSVEQDRFTMEHRAVSEQADEIAAEGGAVIVSFDYNVNEKTSLPEAVRKRIREIEPR